MQAHLMQSDDQRRNTNFIKFTIPQPVPDSDPFVYEYEGYFGCDSKCELQIIENLVIVTEMEDNEGTSITNMAEHLATRVCHQFQIDPTKLQWIEHYPQRGWKGDIDESWDRVEFEAKALDNSIRLVSPKWQHIGDKEAVELEYNITLKDYPPWKE